MENDTKVLNRAQDMAISANKEYIELFEKLDNEQDDTKKEALEEEINQNYGVEIIKNYSITLAGGGPAMRIYGQLDENNEPITAELQYQDWGTPWTELREANQDMLLRIASMQYFGE